MDTSSQTPVNNPVTDPFSYIGRRIIEDHLTEVRKKVGIEGIPQIPGPILASGYDFKGYGSERPVGILGAGIGGLYTALMLDSLNINYEILEASDRSGGRLKTHKFEYGGTYDYYDVGAMRFPLPQKDDSGDYKIGIHRRLGRLINYEKLNQGDIHLKDTVIPYYYKSEGKPGFLYFNRVRSRMTGTPEDSAAGAIAMGVQPAYVSVGANAIMNDAISRFSRMIAKDIKCGGREGWDVLQKYDMYSTRAYLSLVYIPSEALQLPPKPLHTNVVNWCETFENSSTSFDKAWSESVLEYLAFGGGTDIIGEVEWKCFEGGSQTLSNALEAYLTSQHGSIQFNSKVTSMQHIFRIENVPGAGIYPWKWPIRREIGVGLENGSMKTYSHVISTLPLPVLRMIDLSRAGLDTMQSNALRMLQYGPSIKIGMRFKEDWWKTKFGIVGGQSFTDLPIRTIVYPSYGVNSGTPSTTLIVSYCWTADADRWGALINMEDPTQISDQLKTVVLRNLADAHDPTVVSYEYLLDQCLDTFAWEWNGSPYTMGAFAFFGPGNFGDLYKALSRPAGEHRIHFAGELISTRHAWVVGALDSAWRAVKEYLITSGKWETHKNTFTRLWGSNVEWTRSTKSDPKTFNSFPTQIQVSDETYAIPDEVKESHHGGLNANDHPDDDDLSDLMLEYLGFADLFPEYL